MPSISLASYTLRVHERRSPRNLVLGQLPDGKDFIEIFHDYLQSRVDDYKHNEERQTLLRVVQTERISRSISGLVATGVYGHTSELYNIRENAIAYSRTESDAEMLPFYFLLSAPENSDEAILVLQRFGTLGVRKLILTDLRDFLADSHPEFVVDVNPLVPEDVIRRYVEQGSLQKLVITRFHLPEDVLAAYELNGHQEDIASYEMIIRAKRTRSLKKPSWLLALTRGETKIADIAELSELGADKIKMEVSYGGKTRTVDVENPYKMRSYIDITDSVRRTGGHPEFRSVDSKARELLGDVYTQVRGRGNE
jgi:hypothetical protein